MRLVYTEQVNPDFKALCAQLDQYLNTIAGGEEHRKAYLQYNTLEHIRGIVLAYDKDTAVGCAAFQEISPEVAEIKRVYVSDAYRGRRIGFSLIQALEARVAEQGYRRLLLETGEPLYAAMKLYRQMGYRVVENYGPYACMPNSICMEKQLSSGSMPG